MLSAVYECVSLPNCFCYTVYDIGNKLVSFITHVFILSVSSITRSFNRVKHYNPKTADIASASRDIIFCIERAIPDRSLSSNRFP